MRAVICDRCGKRITDIKAGYINLDWRWIHNNELDRTHKFDDWDLCPDCMKQIEDFVKSVLLTQEEPEETKPRAMIRKPMPARITSEQVEQIKAMLTEGTAVKDIAEAVGVSAPTVRKYKKEMEDVGGEE